MSASITCVGLGMKLGAHISPICKSHIEQADVVFCAAADSLFEMWVTEMNPDVRSLQSYYAEGKSRYDTYKQMVEAIMTEVRAGKKVVAAFYGHPCVFARVAGDVIEVAEQENFPAQIEAGISAEDCLYADLRIDPGKFGCQHFETSQLMFYQRIIDPAGYLILWQLAVAGDRKLTRYATGKAYRQILIEQLYQHYPPEHQVILYEAAVLPIDKVRKQVISLADLVDADITQATTLVIPPAIAMIKNEKVMKRLAELDKTTVE
ncbi:SAM-dependent methyltransferase [Neptunicella sp.]|uniref:SAM-dependent methyltransferase n=1 Tax=Neptunicella sp. TaxID=2125986 RepID=UPI003F68F3AC